jgi:hypothetical protein
MDNYRASEGRAFIHILLPLAGLAPADALADSGIGTQAGLLFFLVMLPPSLLSGWLAATRPAIPHWLLFLAAYLLSWIAWVVFVLAMWSRFSPGNMSEGWVGGMAGWLAALAPWFAALAPIFFGFHYLVYRLRGKREG